jgi:hypothetical protein
VTSLQSDKAAGYRFSELNVQMGIYGVEAVSTIGVNTHTKKKKIHTFSP